MTVNLKERSVVLKGLFTQQCVSGNIMAINTFARKEIKFLLSMEQYYGLMEEIPKYMNPDKYCVGGKEYGVYNIYYDTSDDFLIRESISKPYYKEKIRLRSYYSPASPEDTVFLEIKKKIGGIVAKRRVTLTLAEANEYLLSRSKPDSSKYITNQVFTELDAFLNMYDIAPKQYISYQRTAFFGKDNKDFRLTFDRKITERRTELSLSQPSFGNQIIGENQRLMEVKVSDSVPEWLINKLSELQIYKTSFSKYGKAYQNYIYDKIMMNRSVLANV